MQMDEQTLRDDIKKFADRSSEVGIDMVAAWAVPRHLMKNERLWNEGSVCRSFYLVHSGYLRTYFIKDGADIIGIAVLPRLKLESSNGMDTIFRLLTIFRNGGYSSS